jgi:hypothetical protein
MILPRKAKAMSGFRVERSLFRPIACAAAARAVIVKPKRGWRTRLGPLVSGEPRQPHTRIGKAIIARQVVGSFDQFMENE